MPRSLPFALAAIFACTLIAASSGGTPANAAAFTVTKTADTNDGACTPEDCSLREAVIAANTTPGPDTIDLPAGTYVLSIPGENEDLAATGDLDILEDLAITGGDTPPVIDADEIDRVFEIYPGLLNGDQITLTNLVIRGGDTDDLGGGILVEGTIGVPIGTVTLDNVTLEDNHGFNGGAISNGGKMEIKNSTIVSNRAASGPFGGGISNSGEMTITGSTIANNTSELSGGGVHNLGGTLAIDGSTISGNSAMFFGGGLGVEGGTLTITNSTISGNSAVQAGGGIYNTAGGDITIGSSTIVDNEAANIVNDIGTVTLKNTIVANPRSGASCDGPITSQGHNISSDGLCGLNATGDQADTDPMLGPLADNGGPTQTHALLDGSPAIDTGSDDCPPPALDQRGTIRPQGPKCDIGAFEVEAGQTLIWGALLCGAAVGSTDALAVLVVLANLSPLPHPDCPAINDEVTILRGGATFAPLFTGTQKWGDVNCSGAADSIDALAILLFVAHLPAPAPPAGCPDIGDEVVISSG